MLIGAFTVKERIPIWRIHFELCRYFLTTGMRYVARYPSPVYYFNQYLKAFSMHVWFAVFGTLLSFAFTFKLIFHFYSKKFNEADLIGHVTHDPVDFGLLTFAGLTEPEALPWFPKWSAGCSIIIYSYLDALT